MSSYSILCAALAPAGYPVREQGSYGADETLPETHITYDMMGESDGAYYDNQASMNTSTFRVFFYSKKPALVQGAKDTLKSVLLPAGFLKGVGRRLPFDPSTGHYGYVCEYKLNEREV